MNADTIHRVRAALAELDAALRQMQADAEGPPTDVRWLSPKQAAFLANVSDRHMRRIAPRVGAKAGGRWKIDPARLSEIVSDDVRLGSGQTGQNPGESSDGN
ncbi:MAG: hypothetical protein ACR65X_09580 [Methylocystis sp.]